MNGSVYVGQKALSLTEYEKTAPISGVILWVDDENCYEAGDETGTVIEQDCPYATQEMANNLLATLQGYSYQGLEANGAKVSPVAELGDGLTIGGLYTQLAYQNIRFSTGEVMDVSAPGSNETLHEYKTEGETTKQFNHQIAETRSIISKTSEEILLQVENELEGLSSSFSVQLDNITGRVNGLDGEFAELSLTLDGLTVTDSTGKTVINGSMIQTSNLYVDAANISGTLTANQINLTGAITWADLATDAKSQVTSAQNIANNAQDTANSALLQANGAMNVSGETASKVTGWTYTGTTYIDGNKLMTGTVTATTLQGGTVQLIDQNKFVRGEIYIRSASSTSGAAIEFESAGPMALTATSGSLYLSATTIQMACSTARPNGSNQSDLGTTGIRWKDLYLTNSPNVTSDENSKHDIELLPEKYVKLFDRISPYRYKLDAGTSGRYHTGFIAQDVKSGMDFSDITPQEFSAWIEDTDENGDVIYALRYEELIAIAWAKIKELESRIEELEAEL